VTSGVDWPAVAAAISGGVVGLAGIIAAARQSGKTIIAEDARAKLAEKRRIYANCVAALNVYVTADDNAARGTELSPAQNAELLEDYARARDAALNAVSEVDLIAPTEVAFQAHRVMTILLDAEVGAPASEIAGALVKLTYAMRGDLGEQVPRAEEVRDAPTLPAH
jgi:hypothetical protein